jgi:hypothetical protein
VSEATSSAATAAPAEPSPFVLAVLPILILFCGATVLFWLSTQDLAKTTDYWEIFLPTVAVLSLFSGWTQAMVKRNSLLWYFGRQIIHWGALVGLLYLFNLVGFRAMLDDQQYTVLLLGFLAMGTLLASIQMDYKLFFLALFFGFCTYVIFTPDNNPALAWAGHLFRIQDPQANPAIVCAAVAGAGFVGSLLLHLFMPRPSAASLDATETDGAPLSTTKVEAEPAGAASAQSTPVASSSSSAESKAGSQ